MRNTLFALALVAGCRQPAATTATPVVPAKAPEPPTWSHNEWAERLADLEVATKVDPKSGRARLDFANGLIDATLDFLRELGAPVGSAEFDKIHKPLTDFLDDKWTRARAELTRAVELDPDLRYEADMARKRIPQLPH